MTTVHCVEFAAGLTLLQFSVDLRCGCAPRKYCNPVEQQQNLVARGLRDSCIGLQTCDVFEQPTPGPRLPRSGTEFPWYNSSGHGGIAGVGGLDTWVVWPDKKMASGGDSVTFLGLSYLVEVWYILCLPEVRLVQPWAWECYESGDYWQDVTRGRLATTRRFAGIWLGK